MMRQSQYERMLQDLQETHQRLEALADNYGRMLGVTESLFNGQEGISARLRMLEDYLDDIRTKCAYSCLFGFCGGMLAGLAAFFFM